MNKHRHQQMTETYFDKIATASDKMWSGNIDKWSAVQSFFESIPFAGRILECGAGTGMYTIKMLQLGFRVTAVDISEESLEVIRKLALARGVDRNLSTVESEFGDFANRTDEEFDAVVYFKTLHHFPNLTSVAEAIYAGYKSLKPNGALLGLEPNGNCPFWRPFLLAQGSHRAAKESIWQAEKGLLMITRSNLTAIFQNLHNAQWEFQWHYVIPAYLVQYLPVLFDPMNRFFGKTKLKRYSFNLVFRVWKTPVSK